MSRKPSIYDTSLSRDLSLGSLVDIFKAKDVTHIYYKLLSPNDNSKNQPYMAGHITDLGFIPTGKISESTSVSRKTKDPKRKIKYSIELDFSWLSTEGIIYPAPDAKFIYYPQYPEVRLSGFVTRCGFDMGGWMDPQKKGRAAGRVLFFGVTRSKKILAYLAVPESRVAKEVSDFPSVEITGVFRQLDLDGHIKAVNSKDILLNELRRIHLLGWIESKRLNREGVLKRYSAQNGGGYTLEAELGVKPNGYSDPDFMGWEIKQFGVKRCDLINSKPLTLMTPEPDGGYYVEKGVEAFMRQYGYINPVIPDRLDFTGRHLASTICKKSGLTLVIEGYDKDTSQITDAKGNICLLDQNGDRASSWSFTKIMEHWKRKHAKAAYIPSISCVKEDTGKHYNYCHNIRLFEGTTFTRLLHAISISDVYYDPGIKLENAGTRPRTKRRSQFRIKSINLGSLYKNKSEIDISDSQGKK